MNKEIEDALNMLLHCSLKDTEYETQVEQYKIVRKYITNLEQQNKKQKETIDKAEDYVYAHLRQNMLNDFTGANYIQEYMSEPDELLDILNEVSE